MPVKKKKSSRKSVPHKKAHSRKHFITFFISLFIILGAVILTFRNISHEPCANSVSCIKEISGAYDPTAPTGEFLGQAVPVPEESTSSVASNFVLGSTADGKKILVDLTAQHLYAKEGDRTVMDFPVSTGKWGATPTGEFRIWIKLKYTSMVGGNKSLGTYYNLPNVPYTMYFYNAAVPKTQGYGLHGAYWHNNFGHPMSHGCINIKPENAEKLFSWADPPTVGYSTLASNIQGTQIVIYGQTPKE